MVVAIAIFDVGSFPASGIISMFIASHIVRVDRRNGLFHLKQNQKFELKDYGDNASHC